MENAGSKADETKSQQPEQEEAMNDAPAEDTQAGPEATEKDVQAAETLQAVTHAASIEIPEVPTYIAAPPEAPTGFPFAQQHPAGPAAGFAIGGSKFLFSIAVMLMANGGG